MINKSKWWELDIDEAKKIQTQIEEMIKNEKISFVSFYS